jgi:hypothetical protein
MMLRQKNQWYFLLLVLIIRQNNFVTNSVIVHVLYCWLSYMYIVPIINGYFPNPALYFFPKQVKYFRSRLKVCQLLKLI